MVQTEDQATTVSMSVNGEDRWSGDMDGLKTSPEAAAAFVEILTDAGIVDDPADWPEPDRTTWNDLSTGIHIERRNFLHELRATGTDADDVTVLLSRGSVSTDLYLGLNKGFKDEEKAIVYFTKLAAEIYRRRLEAELLGLLKEAREERARESIRMQAVWDRQERNRPRQMGMDDALDGDED